MTVACKNSADIPAGQIAQATRTGHSNAWNDHYNVDRPYTANGLNQLTNAGATSLTYDARGNLASSGADAYGYTSENMLRTGPGGATAAYDPLGRLQRTASTANAATTFGYDGLDLIGEYGAGGSVLRRPPRFAICPANRSLVAPRPRH